ncbi:serine/threonine-protein kinase PknH/PknJ, partial [uncultured Mycobacterium sp.]|uniref:serine/threonine-protein kinase PknH/PknJ n=1 Tax=uncultured Mycobacterium sp. TaxID=171292 RepID=UPI0035CB18F9
ERVLGVGGMGAVYLVADPELPRRDALKVLSAELSRNAEFRTRFMREADVASMLDHPNIVSIYRRGQTEDGLLWIAMQFVDGTDADAALRAGTMTAARAVYIVGEVAKALDYAHEHHVVHRDVKPANFLLSGRVGAEERVLLGDFGIARALDDGGLTATGSLVATVAYAAPELLAGAAVDGRADQYSLGCTLFRLLTGQTPYWTGNGVGAVMMAHLQQPPPRVTDRVPELPTALDAVIAKAMAKDPAQRFSSARELAAAAAGALHDRTTPVTIPWRPIPAAAVSSYPDAAGSGPQWWTQPDGARTQHGGVALPTQLARTPVFAPPGAVKPRRRRRRLIAAAVAAVVVLVGATVAAIGLTHRTDQHRSPAASATPASTTPAKPPPPPPPPLPPSTLDSLLLPPEQVANIMGASNLVVYKSLDALIDDSAIIAQKNCIGAWAPAQHAVYVGSGWTGARAQAVHEPGEVAVNYEIIQAVVALPTAAAAQKFLANQTDQWSACAGTGFTLTYPNLRPQDWVFGTLNKSAAALSMPHIIEGTTHPACQRALAVRNNIVVDVVACRLDITNQGVDIVNAIAAKIPR